MAESAQVMWMAMMMMEEREELDDLHRSKTSCGCCVWNRIPCSNPKCQEVKSVFIPMRVKLNQFYWQRSGGVGNGKRWNRYRP